MRSAVLIEIERLALRVFSSAVPVSVIAKELQELAESNPAAALPLLVQAIVLGMGRRDLAAMRGFTHDAMQRISIARTESTTRIDGEQSAIIAFCDALCAEVELVDSRPVLERVDTSEVVARRAKAAQCQHEALQRLHKVSDAAPDLVLFQVFSMALSALSLANDPTSDLAHNGMNGLVAAFASQAPLAPVAGYFLLCTHRRAKDSVQSRVVGEELLRRYPASLLVRLALVSTYTGIGDHARSLALLGEIDAMVGHSAGREVARAMILRLNGRVREANELLSDLQTRAPEEHLKSIIAFEQRLSRINVDRRDY